MANFRVLMQVSYRNMIKFMSEIFGPPVRIVDFYKGPKLPNIDTREVYLQSYVIKERI